MGDKKRVAAIDMGTNTFHILIVEKKEKRFEEIVRKREWVNLAEFGLGHFNETIIDRIWSTLIKFRDLITAYNVNEVKCIATEAFRVVNNGHELLEKIERELSIFPEIIEGKREAELIYKGTTIISPGGDKPHLIMDIGGGSTEFILYDKSGILWSESFQAGVTYLFNEFVSSDPLSSRDQDLIINYLQNHLSNLFEVAKNYDIESLVGASGSFEVLESMMGLQEKSWDINVIDINHLTDIYQHLLPMTIDERIKVPGVPATRAKLIVVAFLFIDMVVREINPKNILVSPFAMKEGIIKEMLNMR